MKTTKALVLILAAGFFIGSICTPSAQTRKDSVVVVVAEANGLPLVPVDKLPRHGTYWRVMNEGSFLLPMPFRSDDPKSTPIFSLGADGQFLVDGTGGVSPQPTKRQALRGVTSATLLKSQINALQDLIAQVQAVPEAKTDETMMTERFGMMDLNGFGGNQMMLSGYGPSDLWLEILEVNFTNQNASLVLHGTVETNRYQLLYTNNLIVPGNEWTLGEIKFGDFGTNQTDYLYVPISTNSQMFFRAHQANSVVSITSGGQDAVEPNSGISDPGQVGIFYVYAAYATNDLVVYYRVSGVASNGVDYTNLLGSVTVPLSTGYGEIDVAPIQDNLVEGSESVILTLMQTNSYLIVPSADSATVHILDSSTTVSLYPGNPDLIEPDGPPGIPALATSWPVYRSDLRNIDTNTLTVFYQVTGTASNGVDYVFLSGSLTFLPGITATNLDVSPLGDNFIEGAEMVTVTLIPTNSYMIDTDAMSATVTIWDSSTTVSITPGFPNLAIEPNGPPGVAAQVGSFQFSRTDARNEYPEMDTFYRVSGTASNGVDFVLPGVLHFAAGIRASNLNVVPLADTIIEGPESVILTLVATNGYYASTNSASAALTIIDSSTTASISRWRDAIEPYPSGVVPLQTGIFIVSRDDSRGIYTNALTVFYQISGTASNGLDYTNLSGTVTIAPNSTEDYIYVRPLADFLVEGDETVTLTLLATNGYYVTTNAPSATIKILDKTNMFAPVFNLPWPVGIDYHAPSNRLIVSYNFNTIGNPYNFAAVYNNVVVSSNGVTTNITSANWSGVHGLPDEVKLATVKATVGGFTNGDIYCSSGYNIGWLSADGTRSNLTWCVLTNGTVASALPVRGSLYVDQTGTFSNNLIVVTSPGSGVPGNKGVWRVDALGHPTLLANLNTPHLEGVITLTNDVQRWGPWAGKIITGDEDFSPNPVIYTIETNGAVTSYNTTNLISGGIYPEDFDIIPPNQDLYACDPTGSQIVKLSSHYLTNYVGDLLITDAGENVIPNSGKLFIVHWNAASTNFVTLRIPYNRPDGSVAILEHVTFAPINLLPSP